MSRARPGTLGRARVAASRGDRLLPPRATAVMHQVAHRVEVVSAGASPVGPLFAPSSLSPFLDDVPDCLPRLRTILLLEAAVLVDGEIPSQREAGQDLLDGG